jgi:hypothetical protein
MKLMRVGPKGQEKPAILDRDGTIRIYRAGWPT